MRVLQNERPGLEAQHGLESTVGVGDFDLTLAGEGLRGTKREGELLPERQVILVGKLDGIVVGIGDSLVEKDHGGPWSFNGDGEGEGAAVIEGETRGDLFSFIELGRGAVRGEREAERVLLGRHGCGGFVVGGRWIGGKDESAKRKLLDLVEAGAGERSRGVAGVQDELVELGRFGKRFGGDKGGVEFAILVDGEMHGPGIDRFERDGEVNGSGLCGLLPVGFDALAGCGVERDGIDASSAGGGEGEVVLAACDEDIA